MTACRHHVLEQSFCPKTNGAYTWWPLSVVSGLAQASYTVRRIEAQATSKTKTKHTKKKTKNKKNNTKPKKTKIWPNIAVGRLVAESFFFLFFFCFCLFFFFFFLVGFFVFFSEIFGNSQKWSILDRFSNAVNSFRIVFGNKAVRRQN